MSAAGITPLKKCPNQYLTALLAMATLGFYAPYYYSKFIPNLNMMSKLALGNAAGDIKFSATYIYGAIIILISPFAFMAVATLANAADAYTKIFMILLAISVPSNIILLVYIVKILNDIKARIIQIALRYERYDLAKPFVKDTGWYNQKREKGIYHAFNELVDEHNANLKG